MTTETKLRLVAIDDMHYWHLLDEIAEALLVDFCNQLLRYRGFNPETGNGTT